MRIGILTLPLHTNYGGILQAYALQTVLERMGHNVVVINKKPCFKARSFISQIVIIFKRVIKRFILRKNVSIFQERKNAEAYKIKSKFIQPFIDNYIHNFYCKNLSSLKEAELNLDAIVVGSDQIWRAPYIMGSLREPVKNAYLSFAQYWNVKRIAYAASFGTDVWEYSKKETDEIKKLIKKFNAVSLRENGGVSLCKIYLNVEADYVLDPTMLLNIKDYNALIANSKNVKKIEYGLVSYILDLTPEIKSLVTKVATNKGLDVQIFSVYADEIAWKAQESIENWLNAIKNAKFVITDSFHACIFCIIFCKPFVVIENHSRGNDRIKSLVEMFHLKNNFITDLSEYSEYYDYTPSKKSCQILECLRTKSMNFIMENLK